MEVFLVIGSSIISLLPGLPSVQVAPVVIFFIFLPPVLFAAGYFTSWRDFKFNIRPITLLAFGLVLVTTVAVAAVAKFILPGFTWAEGFLLGAIVSPTDASAAATIVRKLNVPRRFISIIEGESLLNDATALTLYRFSLIAVLLGSFSLPNAIGEFVWTSVGGLIVGIAVSYVSVFLMKIINDTQAETTFTFITAYAAYLIAHHIGLSGIIATVAAGIYFGIHFPEVAPTHTRLNAKFSWQTLLFIINGFVFTLLGLELPWVLKSLGAYSISSLLFYGAVISFVVIIVRLMWIVPASYLPRFLFPKIALRDPLPPWSFLFVLGWTGMRGIVSLAAVLAIPNQLLSGAPFPHRDLLIFLTYCVILATLILPTLTLPLIIRYFHIIEPVDKLREEAMARLLTMDGVIEHIQSIAEKEKIPEAVYREFLNQIERRYKVIKTQLEKNPYSSLADEYMAFKRLTIAALDSERETLIRLRKAGEIHDEVFRLLSDELDLEEVRVKSLRV